MGNNMIFDEDVKDRLDHLREVHGGVPVDLWVENIIGAEYVAKMDADDIVAVFEDAYEGEHNSARDYVEELFEDIYDLDALPDLIRYRIDWDGVVHDFECSGEYQFECLNGSVHVFRLV